MRSMTQAQADAATAWLSAHMVPDAPQQPQAEPQAEYEYEEPAQPEVADEDLEF
jgi:hypothetical protein